MKIKELIKLLEEVDNKEKDILILGNETNGEDEELDIKFQNLEIWNEEESITLFVSN